MELFITYIKNKKEGAEVLFEDDSKYFVGYETIKKMGIEKLKTVCLEEMLEANSEFARRFALRYCLDSLTRSEKSEAQLKKKLKTLYITENDAEYAISKLKEKKFISDERLCENFVCSCISANKGKNYIKRKLREKGVAPQAIQSALEAYPQEQQLALLRQLLVKQNSLMQKYPQKVRWDKLMRKAVGAGFKSVDSGAVITEIFSDESESCDADETDYNDYFIPLIKKRIKALINKNSAAQLKRKIMSEFMPKGASAGLIDKVLSEDLYEVENDAWQSD